MKAEFTARTVTNPRLYKDFYKFYYKVSWRKARIILTVIGAVLLFFAAAYAFTERTIPAVILAWIGLMLIIYPRNAYRKPARDEKEKSVEMKFKFGENTIEETYHGEKKTYSYEQVKCVYAGARYVYIFTNDRQAAVLERESVRGGEDKELCRFLEQKMGKDKYKKVK